MVMAVHVFLDFGGIEAIGVFGVGSVVFHAIFCGSARFSHICCCAFCGWCALTCYVVNCPCGSEPLDGVFQMNKLLPECASG